MKQARRRLGSLIAVGAGLVLLVGWPSTGWGQDESTFIGTWLVSEIRKGRDADAGRCSDQHFVFTLPIERPFSGSVRILERLGESLTVAGFSIVSGDTATHVLEWDAGEQDYRVYYRHDVGASTGYILLVSRGVAQPGDDARIRIGAFFSMRAGCFAGVEFSGVRK